MAKNKAFVPAEDLSKLWRALIEFDMLQPGDRILAAALFCVRLHDVDVVAVMRKAEASAEFLQLSLGEVGRKHAVHGVAGKLEGNRRIFFDFCEHSG